MRIDTYRLNELIQICKQYYPTVSDYFIHSVCNEQCMVEQGYEIDEAKGEELYQIAQEELKKQNIILNLKKNYLSNIIYIYNEILQI